MVVLHQLKTPHSGVVLLSVSDAMVGSVTKDLERPIRRLDKVVRDASVRDSQFYGPPPEDNCPCGSGGQARRCHRAADDSWIAVRPDPLLTDARTEYANPGCYARSSNDCDKELTREHFITDELLGTLAWRASGSGSPCYVHLAATGCATCSNSYRGGDSRTCPVVSGRATLNNFQRLSISRFLHSATVRAMHSSADSNGIQFLAVQGHPPITRNMG